MISNQFRMQAKEKISDAARTSSEEGFFNPLEQVANFYFTS